MVLLGNQVLTKKLNPNDEGGGWPGAWGCLAACSSPGHQQAALQQAELRVLQYALHVAVETNRETPSHTDTHTHTHTHTHCPETLAMIGPAGGLLSWTTAPREHGARNDKNV